MEGIIVVFPNRDNAANIRNLLVRGGIEVRAVCTTGAQALHYSETIDEGVVVCGYKLPDMMYSELREYLPSSFEMVVIASPDKLENNSKEGIINLSMPIKVYDLINTVDMILQTMAKKRRRRRMEQKERNPEQQMMIKKAKELLMARNNMSEGEAHRYLQKCSMDSGTNMVETAEMVLSVMRE